MATSGCGLTEEVINNFIESTQPTFSQFNQFKIRPLVIPFRLNPSIIPSNARLGILTLNGALSGTRTNGSSITIVTTLYNSSGTGIQTVRQKQLIPSTTNWSISMNTILNIPTQGCYIEVEAVADYITWTGISYNTAFLAF